MEVRAKIRVLSILQIVAGILYVLAGMFSISFVAVCSREDAITRGYDVPPDLKRVFINHRIVYNWPFTKGYQVLGFVISISTLALLFGSVWYARRLKNRLKESPDPETT